MTKSSKRSRMTYNRNPKALQTRYLGPVRLPTQDGADTATTRVNISFSNSVTSTVGGTIASYVNGGDVASSSDWTALAALYREFRVLAIEARWVPDYNGAYTGTLIHSSGAIAPSRSALAGAPTSLDQVIQKSTWKVFKSTSGVKAHWRMNGIEEAGFSNTLSPSDQNRGGIVWYMTDLSGDLKYGYFYFTFLVECRGRK